MAADLGATEKDALNRHGVFLKKKVLAEVQRTPGMGIFAEEFGVAFNETTAVDLIGLDNRDDRSLIFVFECKRAYTKQKTWVFFRDADKAFRLFRSVGAFGQSGLYKQEDDMPFKTKPPVCSEGYELTSADGRWKASPEIIHDAANQLCRGYLGFVQYREKKRSSHGAKNAMECILPVLVTTAELRVAAYDISQVSLQTGNLDGDLSLQVCEWLILKHPFAALPTPTFSDFRTNPSDSADQANWDQTYRESLFVVNAEKLPHFLAADGLRHFLDVSRT